MLYFGVCYYPEQWPEERWATDARLMVQAGFNVVRMGEFAWSRLEPREGVYDFSWLDRAITLMAAQGLWVMLGTPTASPPPWLMAKHPDAYIVREDGQRATYGLRREYCPSHPGYQEAGRRITAAMAQHYADHPSVFAWQIDNEFGDRCYCPICARSFQEWLRRRHETLDKLNERWGTSFWSHTYRDWSEIPLPLKTAGGPHNPGLALDFLRFASEAYTSFQGQQLRILRSACPKHLITHNCMGYHYDKLNYFELTRDLDIVSLDGYPRGFWDISVEVDPANAALDAHTMRGLKQRNFWVTEQQAGIGGWNIMGVTPRPGELRLWAYQNIAYGADAVLFFRWRSPRYGAEQFWHGLLNHDASLSRRYYEIKAMGAELKHAGDAIAGARLKSQAAIMLSYDSRFAFQIQPNNPELRYSRHLRQCFRALYHHQQSVDIIAPDADLSGYRLLVLPALYLVPETLVPRLQRFVEQGGLLVVTLRSGVKDQFNAVLELPLPGLLRELCGAEVEEYDSLPSGVAQQLELLPAELAGGEAMQARIWCEVLAPKGAEVVARYTADYYAGKPAITINSVGAGKVVYIGTAGDQPLYDALAGWLLKLAELAPPARATGGLELVERWQGQRRLLFALNHSGQPQQLTLDQPQRNLLDGSAHPPGTLTVRPRDVLLLEALDDKASTKDKK